MVQEVNISNFNNEVINSNLPCLVDFYGDACPPCAKLEPIINELSKIYLGSVKIVKCNIYNNPNLGSTYNITLIPTLILFKSGKEIIRNEGFMDKDDLIKLINKHK